MKDDIAIIELEKPIGEKTGWVSIGFDNRDSVLLEKIYYKFSYPAIPFFYFDSTEYNGDTLYYNYGKIQVTSEYSFAVPDATGIPGESGSSMIWVENNTNYISYGVLTGGAYIHNRITNESFYYLKEFIENDLIANAYENNIPTNLILYPNPTEGIVNIKGVNLKDLNKVIILDNWGRKIIESNNPHASPILNLTDRPNGLYHIGVKTNNRIIWNKIILAN